MDTGAADVIVNTGAEAVDEAVSGIKNTLMTVFSENALKVVSKVILSLIILLIAFKLINLLCRKLAAAIEKSKKIDVTLARALHHAVSIGLKVLVVMGLVGYLGIETSGLSAVIGSLGVCVGLAVNGTLSNLAGGVMLLITRPFSVGDYIAAQGMEGTVAEILICNTKIVTADHKVIFLPNSALSTGTITNYSAEKFRRLDYALSVGGNDPDLVCRLLLKIAGEEPLVLQEPAPEAFIGDYATGNGLKITFRCWCKNEAYWNLFAILNKKIKDVFEENQITLPRSQLDVHIKS